MYPAHQFTCVLATQLFAVTRGYCNFQISVKSTLWSSLLRAALVKGSRSSCRIECLSGQSYCTAPKALMLLLHFLDH